LHYCARVSLDCGNDFRRRIACRRFGDSPTDNCSLRFSDYLPDLPHSQQRRHRVGCLAQCLIHLDINVLFRRVPKRDGADNGLRERRHHVAVGEVVGEQIVREKLVPPALRNEQTVHKGHPTWRLAIHERRDRRNREMDSGATRGLEAVGAANEVRRAPRRKRSNASDRSMDRRRRPSSRSPRLRNRSKALIEARLASSTRVGSHTPSTLPNSDPPALANNGHN
jgi:hypothetical protein